MRRVERLLSTTAVCGAALFSLGFPLSGASAQDTLYWNGSTLTGGTPGGGFGTWSLDSANTNWVDGSTAAAWPNVRGAGIGVLGGAGGTVTVADLGSPDPGTGVAGPGFAALSFRDSDYVINGDSIFISPSGTGSQLSDMTATISVDTGLTATFNTVISPGTNASGAAGGYYLEKTGAGTLVLTQDNTFEGMIFSGGEVVASSPANLGGVSTANGVGEVYAYWFNGGKLHATDDIALREDVSVGTAGAELEVDAGKTLSGRVPLGQPGLYGIQLFGPTSGSPGDVKLSGQGQLVLGEMRGDFSSSTFTIEDGTATIRNQFYSQFDLFLNFQTVNIASGRLNIVNFPADYPTYDQSTLLTGLTGSVNVSGGSIEGNGTIASNPGETVVFDNTPATISPGVSFGQPAGTYYGNIVVGLDPMNTSNLVPYFVLPAPGTHNTNPLTLGAQTQVLLDLDMPSISDGVRVYGDLNVTSGASITANMPTSPQAGVYNLITYQGTKNGDFASINVNSSIPVIVDENAANTVRLLVRDPSSGQIPVSWNPETDSSSEQLDPGTGQYVPVPGVSGGVGSWTVDSRVFTPTFVAFGVQQAQAPTSWPGRIMPGDTNHLTGVVGYFGGDAASAYDVTVQGAHGFDTFVFGDLGNVELFEGVNFVDGGGASFVMSPYAGTEGLLDLKTLFTKQNANNYSPVTLGVPIVDGYNESSQPVTNLRILQRKATNPFAPGSTSTPIDNVFITADHQYSGLTTLDGGNVYLGGDYSSTGSLPGDIDIKSDTILWFYNMASGSFANTMTSEDDTASLNFFGLYMTDFIFNSNSSGFTGASYVEFGLSVTGNGTTGGSLIVYNDSAVGNSVGDTITFQSSSRFTPGSSFNAGLNVTPNGQALLSTGDLTIDAPSSGRAVTLSVTSAGPLADGAYALIDYDGTLNGLTTDITIGTGINVPAGKHYTISPTPPLTPGGSDYVLNLIVGDVYTYWNGTTTSPPTPLAVQGGAGTWTVSAATAADYNWTDAAGDDNVAWAQNLYPVFSGATGTVSVDNTDGVQTVIGLKFLTGDYVLEAASAGDVIGIHDFTVGGGTVEVDVATSIGATIALPLVDGGSAATGLETISDGRLILSADNTYSGGTTITAGTIQLGDGAVNGSVLGGIEIGNAGALDLIAASTTTVDFQNVLSSGGNGAVFNVAGTGTVNFNSASGGYGGQSFVLNGATLAMTSSTSALGGDLTVNDGGSLWGTVDNNDLITGGTSLSLNNGSNLRTVLNTTANKNPLFETATVNLDPSSTLYVDSGGADLAAGHYALVGYTSAMNGNATDLTVDTSILTGSLGYDIENVPSGVVYLIVGGSKFRYWNGTTKTGSTLVGGNGTWTANPSDENWTDSTAVPHGPWEQNWVAVFAGQQSGTVSVDTSTYGSITVDGMQFGTDGYIIEGDAITLSTGHADSLAEFRLGPNSSVGATIRATLSGPSGLHKTGDGALTLAGVNTYGVATQISDGTLLVSADNNLGDPSAVLVMDGGTLSVTSGFPSARSVTLTARGGAIEIADSTQTLALSGTLSDAAGDSGTLKKTGAGTLELSGNNDYSGGTVATGGTVSVSRNENLGAAGGSVTLDAATLAVTGNVSADRAFVLGGGGGILDVGPGFTLSNAGALSDLAGVSGALTIEGGGTVVLSGSGSYTGGTYVNAGRLQLGDGGKSGSLTGSIAIAQNAVLAINRSDNFSFDNLISGAGSFEQAGSGTTAVTGDNSGFDGTTNVRSGGLRIDGQLGGSTNVLGGLLSGTGTLFDVAVQSGGSVTPGDADTIDTLSVGGTLGFADGSTYLVNLDGAGDTDLIDVAGTVTISGGVVNVVADGSGFATGDVYTIISSGGQVVTIDGDGDGVAGFKPDVATNLAYLSATVGYTANTVFLTLTDSDDNNGGGTFCLPGMTTNQCNTGKGVHSLGPDNPLYPLIQGLPGSEAGPALDSLSGEFYASANSAMINDSRYVREATRERIRGALGGITTGEAETAVSNYASAQEPDGPFSTFGEKNKGIGLWTTGYGAWSQFKGQDGTSSMTDSVGGIFFGADAAVFDNMRFGALFGYGSAFYKVEQLNSKASSNDYTFALYGGGAWGPLGTAFGTAYTWHDVSSKRWVSFPGLSEEETADYGAGTFQLYGEVTYSVALADNFAVEPFVDASYINQQTDGFTENGGIAALHQKQSDTNTGLTTIGIRTAHTMVLGDVEGEVTAALGWRHAYGDLAPEATMNFPGGTPFDIFGVPMSRDQVLVNVGWQTQLRSNVSLELDYFGLFGEGYESQNLTGALNISF